MNYLTEIKLFYDWLETNPLPASAISLWHALMSIANRSGWSATLKVPYALLEVRTGLSRTTIYRERNRLRKVGRITVRSYKSNLCATYGLIPLKRAPEFPIETHSAMQSEIQNETESATQGETEEGFALQGAFQNEHIYRLNSDIVKEKTNKKENDATPAKERKSCAKKRETKRLNEVAFLDSLEEPWCVLMASWFEYKRIRRESYSSEMGAKKCLAQLRRLSGDNPSVAAAIIDRSMANNWAGLFALHDPSPPQARQYGQRIGQIMQSADEQRRQHFIDKLRGAGKTNTEIKN